MKNFLKSTAIFACIALMFCACGEDDTAVGVVKSSEDATLYSGEYRAILEWTVPEDDNITGSTVSWTNNDNTSGSQTMDVLPGQEMQFQMINLPLGDYTVTLTNRDASGGLSNTTVLYTEVYDASTYSKRAPSVDAVNFSDSGTNAEITWGSIHSDCSDVEVSYVNNNDEVVTTTRVSVDEVMLLTDAQAGQPFTYTAYFCPSQGLDEVSVTSRAILDTAPNAPGSVVFAPGDSRMAVTWSLKQSDLREIEYTMIEYTPINSTIATQVTIPIRDQKVGENTYEIAYATIGTYTMSIYNVKNDTGATSSPITEEIYVYGYGDYSRYWAVVDESVYYSTLIASLTWTTIPDDCIGVRLTYTSYASEETIATLVTEAIPAVPATLDPETGEVLTEEVEAVPAVYSYEYIYSSEEKVEGQVSDILPVSLTESTDLYGVVPNEVFTYESCYCPTNGLDTIYIPYNSALYAGTNGEIEFVEAPPTAPATITVVSGVTKEGDVEIGEYFEIEWTVEDLSTITKFNIYAQTEDDNAPKLIYTYDLGEEDDVETTYSFIWASATIEIAKKYTFSVVASTAVGTESLYTSAVATAYNAAYFTEPANQPEVEASVSGTTAIFKWKNVSSALSTVDVLSGSTTVATYSYDELAAGFTDAKVASGTLASSFTYNATFVYTADGDFTDVTVSIPAADNSGTGYTIDTDGTWLISNANGLAAFLNTVEDLENSGATKSLSLNARLTDHIDLSTLYGDDLDNWSPLGSVWGSGYAGTFDGDGYTINGLYLVATDGGEFKAMFGVLTGTVKNLTLRNPVISSTGMNVGAFVGNCNAGTLTGCSVVGSGASIIGAANYVGGLVGTLQGAGTVSDCYNEATVTTTASNCGGIVGYMNDASAVVDNCSNAGTIVSSTTYFGGVVGYDNGGGTISNCSNSGTFVAVGSYAGGIVGATKGTVTACTNSADLTSTATNFAGIAGYNNAGTVSDCRNTGYLYSTATYLGGIVGYNSGLLVGCGNAGTIYSTARYIGGITGYNTSVIANCHNEAEGWVGTTDYTAGGVTAHNNASAYVIGCSNAGTLGDTVGPDGTTISDGGQHGGVIGYDAGGYVVGCYNTGSVTSAGTAANTCVGGIVGSLTTGTLFYGCYSTGDLSGIVSNNSHGYVSGATGSTVTYDNFSYCFYVDVDDDTLTDGAPTARLVDTTTSESATTLYDASSIAGVNAQITNMNTAIATALGTIQAAVTSYTINDYYFVAGTDSTVDSPSIVEVVAAQ